MIKNNSSNNGRLQNKLQVDVDLTDEGGNIFRDIFFSIELTQAAD